MSILNSRPITAEFGVEVLDIDLSQQLSDQLFSQLKSLYFEHSLLLFRHQNLTPADSGAFCASLRQAQN